MTTTPGSPEPDHTGAEETEGRPGEKEAPGAEIGLTEGEGSSFEPEEDPEGNT